MNMMLTSKWLFAYCCNGWLGRSVEPLWVTGTARHLPDDAAPGAAGTRRTDMTPIRPQCVRDCMGAPATTTIVLDVGRSRSDSRARKVTGRLNPEIVPIVVEVWSRLALRSAAIGGSDPAGLSNARLGRPICSTPINPSTR